MSNDNNAVLIHFISHLKPGGAENRLVQYVNYKESCKHIIIRLGLDVALEHKLNNLKSIWILDLPKMIRVIFLLNKYKKKILIGWQYHGAFLSIIFKLFCRNTSVIYYFHREKVSIKYFKKSTFLLAYITKLFENFASTKKIHCTEKGKKNHISFGFKSQNFLVVDNGFEIKGDVSKQASKKTKIIFISRDNKIKNNDLAFDIFHKTSKIHKDIELLVVGPDLDHNNKRLLLSIERFNEFKNIKLLGYKKNINEILKKVDINLKTSLSEAFPLSIGESMIYGVPSVSTDVGSCKRIIGKTGKVFKNNDAKDGQKALTFLLDEKKNFPEKWELRKELCRERIISKFELYDSLNKLHKAFLK